MPNVIKSVADTIGENVAEPTVDQVGQLIEVGAQSVTGTGQMQVLDPEEQARKQAEEQKRELENQKKAQNIKQFLTQLAADDIQRLRRSQQEEQQRRAEEQQVEAQQDRMEEIKEERREEELVVKQQKTRAEQKGGVGG